MIRFEREGEKRFARWIGGDNRLDRGALHRLFAEAEPGDATDSEPAAAPGEPNDHADARSAPLKTVTQWLNLVATMGPDELAALGERTFPDSDRASLTELRGAIRNRWRQLAGD